ncbi:hypothetical protein [Methanooceanicella nereidis]|uniref:hypothetical protein n=1 Tax=Methanooceanicella nereidis TaxID=2052831 RepID=UPI001E473EF0|nr:hypothetical protein [Methanocella sp. CWC-04]
MSHPLEAYFCETKNGNIPDEKAKDTLKSLVNDDRLIKDVCSIFNEYNNVDTVCYAVGKLYDVNGESYGCITILSEDVFALIGKEDLEQSQERFNHILIGSYLEYKKYGKDLGQEVFETWDEYVDIIMSKNFLSLYENGVRAKLIHNTSIANTSMPVVVFILYQNYDVIYG